MTKKLGRPKLPKKEVRTVFHLRLSETERALYDAAAKSRDVKLPKWIRETLTKEAKLIVVR